MMTDKFLRKQVSLKFTDSELYHALIEPLHENRQLTDIIIKCLSAYYYNEEWRTIVDGTSTIADSDTIFDDGNKQADAKASIKEVRQLLQMQSILMEEFEDTIADGTDSINASMSMAKVNDEMEKRGYVHREQSDSNTTVLTITDNARKVMEQNNTTDTHPTVPNEVQPTVISPANGDDMSNLFSQFMNFVASEGAKGIISPQSNVEIPTPAPTEVIEEPTPMLKVAETQPDEAKVEVEPVIGEAKDALKSLMSSLDF